MLADTVTQEIDGVSMWKVSPYNKSAFGQAPNYVTHASRPVLSHLRNQAAFMCAKPWSDLIWV